MSDWWHFLVWKQFNDTVFKKTLTAKNKVGRKFFIDEFTQVFEDGNTVSKEIMEKVYKFEKNGEFFLLKEDWIKKLPLNPTKHVEGYLKDSDKTIFKLILEPSSVKITPEKSVSVKDFITLFNFQQHSNEKTRLFLNMIVLASAWKPIKFCLCSEPGSGKSSGFHIVKYITNDVVRVESPTKAKLETLLFFYKTLVIDEMSTVTKADLRNIEPTFLTIADESPEIEKHSMAQNSAMNEMDLEETSIIFTFNRLEDVKKLNSKNKFFDEVWNNLPAFKRRYPSVLLEGVIQTERVKFNKKQANDVMTENFDNMRRVAKQFVYLSQSLDKEFHHWKNRDRFLLRGQQKINFEGVIDVVDAFCDSQEEFDEWVTWINNAICRYDDMAAKLIDERLELGEREPFEEYLVEDEE